MEKQSWEKEWAIKRAIPSNEAFQIDEEIKFIHKLLKQKDDVIDGLLLAQEGYRIQVDALLKERQEWAEKIEKEFRGEELLWGDWLKLKKRLSK